MAEVTNLPFATALPSRGISAPNLYVLVLVAAQQFNLPCSVSSDSESLLTGYCQQTVGATRKKLGDGGTSLHP